MGGFSSADIFSDKFLQMRTFASFGVNTSDFSKLMVCPHEQGERG